MMEEESQEQRPPCQYTVEELEAVLEQAEAEDNIDSEEVHDYFEEKYPFLHKQTAKRPPCQYTIEELKERVLQADADDRWMTTSELRERLVKKYPFLCL